jgi:hypothetical protein
MKPKAQTITHTHGLAQPLRRATIAAAAHAVPDAHLLAGVLLLEVLEGVHVQLPAHRLALLPPDLLLLDRVPQLSDRVPLPPCEPGRVVVRLLRQNVNGGLCPGEHNKIISLNPKTKNQKYTAKQMDGALSIYHTHKNSPRDSVAPSGYFQAFQKGLPLRLENPLCFLLDRLSIQSRDCLLSSSPRRLLRPVLKKTI